MMSITGLTLRSSRRDEIALRFHTRRTWIHSFPSGDRGHARLTADLLVVWLSGERFSWGGAWLARADKMRRSYIAAVRAEDQHDLGPLLQFARS